MKNIELLLVALFCLYGCGQPKPQKSSPEVHIPVPEMYQKPFKYIGMDVKEASQLFAVQENSGGNLVFDTAKQHYLFEANDGKISYVDIGFLETVPCNQAIDFDSEPLLLALGVSPSSLQLIKKRPHFHTYYDHVNKLKVGVSCLYDGAALSVGFSRKYYSH